MATLTFFIRYKVVYFVCLLYNSIPSFILGMNFHLRKQQKSPIKLVKHIGGSRVLRNLDRKLTFKTTQMIDK